MLPRVLIGQDAVKVWVALEQFRDWRFGQKGDLGAVKQAARCSQGRLAHDGIPEPVRTTKQEPLDPSYLNWPPHHSGLPGRR